MTSFRSVSHDASGSPATANSQRQWRYGYGGGGGAAIPVHPLSPFFEGGYTGAIYDGTLSAFFQNSDGTSPCVADGDPVGFVQDYNLTLNDAIQASSPNKPQFRLNNGIKGFGSGNIDGMSRYLATSLQAPDTGYTQAFVYIRRSASTPVFSAGRGGFLFTYDDNNNISWYDSGLQMQTSTTGSTARLFIVSTDAPPQQCGLWRYNNPYTSGAFSGGQITLPAAPNPAWTLGDGDLTAVGGSASYAPVDIFFALHINRPRQTSNLVESIRSYVAGAFTALTV